MIDIASSPSSTWFADYANLYSRRVRPQSLLLTLLHLLYPVHPSINNHNPRLSSAPSLHPPHLRPRRKPTDRPPRRSNHHHLLPLHSKVPNPIPLPFPLLQTIIQCSS